MRRMSDQGRSALTRPPELHAQRSAACCFQKAIELGITGIGVVRGMTFLNSKLSEPSVPNLPRVEVNH